MSNGLTLHRITAVNRIDMIRQCSVDMGDTKLIAKLSEFETIYQDAFITIRATGFTNL